MRRRPQPRSRFLRSVICTAAQLELAMPWTRARPEELAPKPSPKPSKVVQFRRA